MKNLAFLTAFIGLLLASCSPTYYAPGTMSAPGLQEKGDVKIGLYSNSSSDSESSNTGNGIDIELAFSPFENVGVVYHKNSFSSGFSNRVNQRSGPYGIPIYDYEPYISKGSIHNVGAGYYRNLSERWIWESYGTIGLGSFIIEPEVSGSTLRADLRKTSAQTGILYRNSFFEFGANYGLATLRYNNIRGDVRNNGESQNTYLSNRNNHLLSNFATTLRLGYKPVKIQLQMGATKNLTDANFKMNDSYASIGLFFSVDELIKK